MSRCPASATSFKATELSTPPDNNTAIFTFGHSRSQVASLLGDARGVKRWKPSGRDPKRRTGARSVSRSTSPRAVRPFWRNRCWSQNATDPHSGTLPVAIFDRTPFFNSDWTPALRPDILTAIQTGRFYAHTSGRHRQRHAIHQGPRPGRQSRQGFCRSWGRSALDPYLPARGKEPPPQSL